jgi:cyclase
MHKLLAMSLATGMGCAANLGAAQQMQNQPLQTHQLTPTVYWVEGGGGNSGIIVGDKGVVIVDAKITPEYGKQLLGEVAKVTPKPVTTVILTHRDVDHLAGLGAFPKGIEIIAHDIVPDAPQTKPPAAAQGRGPGGPGNSAPPPVVQPTLVWTGDKEDISIDGVKIELRHWAPAHTSGDTVVYLPDQKIVFTGDIIAPEMPVTLIHLYKHGTSAGWIASAKGMLGLDADLFVSGHGEVQSKQQINARLQKAISERAQIEALVKQGKSLAEIQKEVNDPPAEQPPTPQWTPYSEVVYTELTQR